MTLGKLIRIGAAALGALTVSMNADAADLNGYGGYKGGPGYAAVNWSGLYIGANGGYAWRDTSDQFAYAACASCGYPAYGGIGADGGFGGGQIGYNLQSIFGTPSLVAGIEADIQGAGISGSATDQFGETFKTNLDWFGTVRGRIGYAANSTLFYFTGGFAFGGLRQHGEDNTDPNLTANYDFNGTVTGYVLGGGIEYKFSPSWSLKAEYQYLNFGKNNATTSAAAADPAYYGATASADGYKVSDDAFHTVRVGVNYWVSPAYMPLK